MGRCASRSLLWEEELKQTNRNPCRLQKMVRKRSGMERCNI